MTQGGRGMWAWAWIPLVALVSSFPTASAAGLQGQGRFDEHLTLRPLPDGRLHTLFSFVLKQSDDREQYDTEEAAYVPVYSTVPRSLIHLAQSSEADEFHLAINAGRWDYEHWGNPEQEQMVGTGAEVMARLGKPIEVDIQPRLNSSIPPALMANWRKLTANLAGQFCASLDALDERLTIQPFHHDDGAETTTLQAFLASESICTENLSTLLKLLPCKSMTGLASLLKPHRIFTADFHGVALHMQRDGNSGWIVKMNVQAVFAPAMRPIRQKRDWSLNSIFGSAMLQSCPLVSDSYITVLSPSAAKAKSTAGNQEEEVDFTVWPIVVSQEESLDDQDDEKTLDQKAERFARKLLAAGSYTFDTRSSKDLDVQMKWPREETFRFPSKYVLPALLASRTFSGHGQERGKMELTIYNTQIVGERTVTYVEVLPRFIKPYLHTLSVQVEAEDFDEEQDNIVRFQDDLTSPLLLSLNYSPNPFHIEAKLRIPPQSNIRLTLEYDKSFLRYAQHPPDAHRGFDVAPAFVLLEDGVSRIYTNPALIEVAVPDFSMPYNVIIFTSTLIALCAGSTLNNLLRKYTDVVVVT